MTFENMRIDRIKHIKRHIPVDRRWTARGRHDHILGTHIGGQCFHDFGYQSFTLEDNCIFFLNQKDEYRVNVLEKGVAFVVHFTTTEPIDTDSFCIQVQSDNEIISILEKMEALKSTIGRADLMLMSQMYRLCAEVSRIRLKPYAHRDPRLVQARAYMDANFAEEDCLSHAAASCGISRRRFNDLFKTHFDITPNRYLVLTRMDHARELLQAPGISVAEAALRCGFRDIYYFSRVFKAETGIPPSRWKAAGRYSDAPSSTEEGMEGKDQRHKDKACQG